MYDVKVYQEGCGELIVAEVDVEDSADPDMIRLVVCAYKPGDPAPPAADALSRAGWGH